MVWIVADRSLFQLFMVSDSDTLFYLVYRQDSQPWRPRRACVTAVARAQHRALSRIQIAHKNCVIEIFHLSHPAAGPAAFCRIIT